MAYQSETVSAVVNRLNVQYFLPAIQREFVWLPEQIIKLFDSIMRGYPISSFLFWELKPENMDKWEVYKFVEDFKQGQTHNVLANTDSVQQLVLVLDGQQRLTSLLLALRGTYTVKKKYKRYDSPDAWAKQRLYLNLLKDPKTDEEDGEAGVRYGFRFAEKPPKNDVDHYWIRFSRILAFDSEERFYEFRDEEREKLPDDVTKRQISLFDRNLERLYRAIWKDTIISYYTEHDQDYDRVLDIFVRANEGGTKLSKSDLLLSMITSKWGGVNAREDIYGFVDRLNNDLDRRNGFDKDFVMKTCLVMSDLPVQYRVENFNNQNLATIQDRWTEIKAAIEATVKLVNSFGVDRDTLTSANALIPIAYYLGQRPGTTLLGSASADATNATSVRTWLLMALLNGVFGGQSDNVLREIRRVLQERNDADFPIRQINAEVSRFGKSSYFDEPAIANFLSLTYGKQITFLGLSLLYNENRWGTMSFHQDHIFPRSQFSSERLAAAGVPESQHRRYQYLMNNIANLELLTSRENQEKSNMDFLAWLNTRDTAFRDKHLIPDDDDLLKWNAFEDFVDARSELIRQRLESLFSPSQFRKIEG